MREAIFLKTIISSKTIELNKEDYYPMYKLIDEDGGVSYVDAFIHYDWGDGIKPNPLPEFTHKYDSKYELDWIGLIWFSPCGSFYLHSRADSPNDIEFKKTGLNFSDVFE